MISISVWCFEVNRIRRGNLSLPLISFSASRVSDSGAKGGGGGRLGGGGGGGGVRRGG